MFVNWNEEKSRKLSVEGMKKKKNIGWKHTTMVKNCCHKYYFLKLYVFELLPN
jgi:hypothetical protein